MFIFLYFAIPLNMSKILQEKLISKENSNKSPLLSDSLQEKNIPKSFQSEGVSTIQNSLENSKENMSNVKEKILSSSEPKKENISQQKNIYNFFPKNNSNNNKDKDNNGETIILNEENEAINNKLEDVKKKNLEKIENLLLSKKRLMKKSDVILKNKLLKKMAKNFFDKEAELGSDNEEHDDLVKKVYHSDSDSEKENDKNAKDIDNLIDNEEKENYIQNKKFFDDMLEKDHDEILQVIEGPKKRIVKELPKKIMIEDNGLSLKIRMERMNDMNMLREEEEENNEENKFKNLENKLKELKKQSQEDEMNEELKEMIEINNNKIIKQISIMTGQQNKRFKEHLQQNKEILKNVINNEEDSMKKEENKNEIIVKGNGAAKLGNKKFKPFCGMGKFGNCKNSLLNYIKKEKGNNPNNKGNIKNIKNHTTSFHSNLKLNDTNDVRFSGNLNDMFLKKGFN